MTCNSCRDKYDAMLPNHSCDGRVVGTGCGCDHKKCCGCPEPIESITQPYGDRPGVLRFNYGGRSVEFDFTNLVRMVQTDTSESVNPEDRALVYSAERHTDEITASELGSILHIADIGDVDIRNVEDGSLLVYQKNSTCANGCTGIDNVWKGWNAYDDNSLETTLNSLMGFDGNGQAHSLNTPVNQNQYYNLGWNAGQKLSYAQPTEFATFPVDSSNYAYIACYDPATKRPGYVKVKKGTTITV